MMTRFEHCRRTSYNGWGWVLLSTDSLKCKILDSDWANGQLLQELSWVSRTLGHHWRRATGAPGSAGHETTVVPQCRTIMARL